MVSGLSNLGGLYCYNNQLTSLNVSGCSSLGYMRESNIPIGDGVNTIATIDNNTHPNLVKWLINNGWIIPVVADDIFIDNSIWDIPLGGLNNTIDTLYDKSLNEIPLGDLNSMNDATYSKELILEIPKVKSGGGDSVFL